MTNKIGTNYFAKLNNITNISQTNEFGYAVIADCNGDPNIIALDSYIYNTGCIMFRNDILSGSNIYSNIGTLINPSWQLIGGSAPAVISIASITSLQNYSGSSTAVFVSDALQGGYFYYSNASLTADGGITFPATGVGSGFWVRQINPGDNIRAEWFGLNSGLPDNVTNLQNAMNYVHGVGGGVISTTTPGQYNSSQVTMYSKIKLLGPVGATYDFSIGSDDAVIFVRTAPTTTLFSIAGTEGCYIEGLSFNGNGGDAAVLGTCFTADTHTQAFSMFNCKVYNFNIGVDGAATGPFTPLNCTFRQNNYGIYNFRDSLVTNNTFSGNRLAGIYLNNGQVSILGNFFEFTKNITTNNSAPAIYMDGSSNRIRVENNTFDRNSGNDITIAPSSTVNMVLSSVSGTYQALETITGGISGVTATVVVGGTTAIQAKALSGNFTVGETITGSISGAMGTYVSQTYLHTPYRIQIVGNQFKRAGWAPNLVQATSISIKANNVNGLTVVGNDWYSFDYGAGSPEGIMSPTYAFIFTNCSNIVEESNNFGGIVNKLDLVVQNPQAYIWTQSTNDSNEWYLQRNQGSHNPWIWDPSAVEYAGAYLVLGTPGSLTASQYGWGNADSLIYNTLYIRLPGGVSPSTVGANTLFAEYNFPPTLYTNCTDIKSDENRDFNTATLLVGNSTTFTLKTRDFPAAFSQSMYTLRISAREEGSMTGYSCMYDIPLVVSRTGATVFPTIVTSGLNGYFSDLPVSLSAVTNGIAVTPLTSDGLGSQINVTLTFNSTDGATGVQYLAELKW